MKAIETIKTGNLEEVKKISRHTIFAICRRGIPETTPEVKDYLEFIYQETKADYED